MGKVYLVLGATITIGWWVSAVAHWMASLGHLSGKTSLGGMLMSGLAAFDEENFTERGRVLRARFLLSFVGFFVSAMLTGAAAAVAGVGR